MNAPFNIAANLVSDGELWLQRRRRNWRAGECKAPGLRWPIRAGQSDHKLLVGAPRARSEATEHQEGRNSMYQ